MLTTLPGTTQLIVRANWNSKMVYFVDCQECGRQNVIPKKATVCPNCQKGGFPVKFTEDKHKTSFHPNAKPRHECGPKCVSATGPNCECKCEGLNHGRAS